VRRRTTTSSAVSLIADRVDTTGAGDLFAAGFLFGYTQGRTLEDCGKLGCLAAGIVIEQIGPRPMRSLSEAAKEAGFFKQATHRAHIGIESRSQQTVAGGFFCGDIEVAKELCR